MPAIPLRSDWDAGRVRDAARLAEDAAQVRRLLAIAAVYNGMSRAAAATLGGMDRQTLRDWVHRFNAAGPSGLVDRKGAAARLTPDQQAELTALVEAGPKPETDGVVRWRCIDLKALIRRRFGIDYHERTIGKLLTGWVSRTSASARDITGRIPRTSRRSKKLPRAPGGDGEHAASGHTGGGMVPG